MGLPTTKVTFVAPAVKNAARAEHGVLAVIVADETKTFDYKVYTALADVDDTDYTDGNYEDISRAFIAAPYKVIVVRIDEDETITDATAILDNLEYDWVCTNVSALQSGLASYVKSINTEYRARKAKCIVTGVTAADDEHVVNVANSTVTVSGDSTTTAVVNYLPRVGGIMAACPFDRSTTALTLDDLSDCSVISAIDSSINAGNLCLHRDGDKIKIARGVNTLQTIGTGKTADMKKIAVVEAMDITQQEIILLFKNNYLGRVKNDSDHQALFISDVIGIVARLAQESVLDDAVGTSVEIDVSAMRAAWASAGVDVSDLSDAQVRDKTYGSTIFVVIRNVKFLDAMEDMDVVIQLNP